MATLTRGITVSESVIEVLDPGTPRRGARYRIGDELMEFIGPGDGVYREVAAGQYQWDGDLASWHVSRGAEGTVATSHDAEAIVTEFLVTATSEGGGGLTITGTDTDGAPVELDASILQVIGGTVIEDVEGTVGFDTTQEWAVGVSDASVSRMARTVDGTASADAYSQTSGDGNATAKSVASVDGPNGTADVRASAATYGGLAQAGSTATVNDGAGEAQILNVAYTVTGEATASLGANRGGGADTLTLYVRVTAAGLSQLIIDGFPGLPTADPAVAGQIWVDPTVGALRLSGTGVPEWVVRTAEGVPSGAPVVGELPIAYDSTAVTGGTYLWIGAAWVKVATIL